MNETEKNYVTLSQEGCAEYEEKKSVFIGHALHVETEAEALAYIKTQQKKYYDATHNVYAYLLAGGSVARYSDDGEPSGTSGLPTLEAIRKSGVEDAVIVITRYFGGTLLGAGGLVRAYSHTAKIAMEAAGIVTYEPYTVFRLACSYADYQKIAALLPRFDAIVDGTDFADNVTLTFAIRTPLCEALERDLCEMSAGKQKPERIGTRFDHA